jgi:hypothetical protein
MGTMIDLAYVYFQRLPGVWVVGRYNTFGEWQSENDYGSKIEAAERANWLNLCESHRDMKKAGHPATTNRPA